MMFSSMNNYQFILTGISNQAQGILSFKEVFFCLRICAYEEPIKINFQLTLALFLWAYELPRPCGGNKF